jgi:hypothetical protein
MIELAAMYGYDMEGNSLLASDEEYSEEDDMRTESEFQSGQYDAAAEPTSSESRPETGSQSGASFGGFGEGTTTMPRPRRGRLDRHRGVNFKQMQSIFDALVRDCYDHNSQHEPISFALDAS